MAFKALYRAANKLFMGMLPKYGRRAGRFPGRRYTPGSINQNYARWRMKWLYAVERMERL